MFFAITGYFFPSIKKSDIKDWLIRSPIAEIYVKYVRDGKKFDNDHVQTQLDNGMPIIVNIHDRCVCWFVRLMGYWDRNETSVLKNIIKDGFNIIEVGANFGVHTLRMAKLVGEKGTVQAFEANPMVSKYLKESVKLNNLANIIKVFEKAAGNERKQVFLDYDVKNIGGGCIVSSPSSFALKTEVVRLDDVIKQQIDLLKIDAEGYELKILQGAQQLINANENIIIMLEFVPSHLEKQGDSAIKLLTFLRNNGFSIWKVGKVNQGEKMLVPISVKELLKLRNADIVAAKHNIFNN